MPEQWTREQFTEYIERQYQDQAPEVLALVFGRWAARGDGAAVYENQDLGHPELGSCQIASFGSTDSQLETDEPPKQLPDIGGRINWRYQLIATYREERQ